jgi:Do/DeqQ family serine protease
MHKQMLRNQLTLLSVVAVMLLLGTGQVLAVSAAASSQGIPSLASMLEQVTPAVVSIRVSKRIPTNQQFRFDGEQAPEDIRRFLEQLPDMPQGEGRGQSTSGAGSGVIVDAGKGLILTNHHVVEGAERITVSLSDNRNVEAKLLGSDSSTDVALLEIEAGELTAIEFADIETVQVGDYVVAIGNPFGIGQTVTSGIVSALGRGGLNRNNYEDFIQTDAAINLGNSGGALVDMEGNLIGINTAIISGNGGSNGIGFAVPADMLLAVMGHLELDGEVHRGLLGVQISDVTPEVVEYLDVGVNRGALVTSVLPNSAAERAGILVSDVIVQIDNKSVQSSRELRNIVGLKRQDQEVDLVLYRDGLQRNISAIIGGNQGQASANDTRPATTSQFRGAQLRSTEGDADAIGVKVGTVQSGSNAWNAGLRQGDVITEVNREQIKGLLEFKQKAGAAEQFTALTVLREGRRMLLILPG